MIPTIDLSPVANSAQAPASLVQSVGDAAREAGAFNVVGHGISAELICETYRVSEELFMWPRVEKMRYYIGSHSTHRGYVPVEERGAYPDELARAYEAFDLGYDLPPDDPDSVSSNRLLGPNQWPALEGFKEVVSAYYQRVTHVSLMICGLLERYLDVPPGQLTQHMTRPTSQLRLLRYHAPSEVKISTQAGGQEGVQEGVNMGAHTDYECLTLVHQNAPGLQLLTSSGEWFDVPVDQGALCVNIGDLLEVWSNGLLTSTLHRVVNREAKRQSLVYFAATDYDVTISPLKNLVTAERPVRYEPIHAGEHLERMLRRDFPYLRALDEATGASGQPLPGASPFERRAARDKP